MLTLNTRNSRLMKDLDDMIKDTIKYELMAKLGIIDEYRLRRLEYFVVYAPGKNSKKKIVNGIYVRKRGQQLFARMRAEEIDITGASVFEYISFLKAIRSRRIKPDMTILENL